MPQIRTTTSLGLLTLAMACAGRPPIPENAPTPAPSSLAPVPIEVTKSPAAVAAAPAPALAVQKPPAPTPRFRLSKGLATPESVLYDEANDRYLVSNSNGGSLQHDNNGYLSEVSPDGTLLKEKFIAGGVGRVKLDAPRGSGISAGVLYVADIDVVRSFDLKTAVPKAEFAVPGATCLSDVAVSKDGRVFVADAGLKAGVEGWERTGTDAVYEISNGKLQTHAKGPHLGGPNALLAIDRGLLVATLGAAELYRLDDQGAKHDLTTLPEGGLYGIAQVGDSLLISSANASAIYRGRLGGSFVPAFTGLTGAADLAVDGKRQRVLITRRLDNALEAYDLK